MRTITEQGHTFEEWMTPAQIAKDVQQVADQINRDYADKVPLFVVVLNGAFVFAADLLRRVEARSEVTFIRVSSYYGMASQGKLNFLVLTAGETVLRLMPALTLTEADATEAIHRLDQALATL